MLIFLDKMIDRIKATLFKRRQFFVGRFISRMTRERIRACRETLREAGQWVRALHSHVTGGMLRMKR